MDDFVNVGALEEFPDNSMKQVIVKGEPIGVYRFGSHLFATHDMCTHEETFLTEGEFDVDDLEVECQLHGSRFNVESGAVRILPATKPVRTYQVKLEGGHVLIGPERDPQGDPRETKEFRMADQLLHIEDLHVEVEGKEILKGLNLSLDKGDIHAIMGPNGSGKSTLAYVLTGRPGYEVTQGKVLYNGEDILDLAPDERAQKGIFLAFQYPTEVPGVSVVNFLRTAYNAIHSDEQLSAMKFRMYLQEKIDLLEIPSELVDRYVNQGFSGGEKKRNEILQMAVLQPELAIMDETDSGLDIDALKHVSAGVNKLASPDVGILLITHYQRLLNYIRPSQVHVLMGGRVVKSGGFELAERLEAEGYAGIAEELGLTVEETVEVE